MATQFAKLFQHDKYGQILITRKSDDTGDPAVAVAINPGSPLDVCEACISFPDDDKGHEKRQGVFDSIDSVMAEELVERLIWAQVSHFLDN